MKTPAPSHHLSCPTPLGELRLAATSQGLCGVWFVDGQAHGPVTTDWGAPSPAHPVLAKAARQLGDYFASRRARFDLPLDLSAGTPFQQAVWRALLGIDAGDACSYRQVAERLGRPAAVRAVGAAVGANPLSIVVPCHRVLGASGALTGYAGGLARKTALLRREGWMVDAPAVGGPPSARARARRAV